jgi:hypothetical protein
MMNLRNILLAGALGGAIATGAVLPAAAQVYGDIYVQSAPPAPIYETVPAAPGPGYYWINGYWRWNGSRYVWAHGYYATAPYSGASWHAGHWAQNRYGWYWRAGHWGRPY